MPIVGFEYCSLHYLNQWLRNERAFCEAIEAPVASQRLKANSDAATFFRVARNPPAQYEAADGKQRYRPVLEILDSVKASDISEKTVAASVEKVRSQISRSYGEKEVLSFTSKLMWVKLKSPVVIYDKRAREALRTKAGDYESYCSRWRETYQRYTRAIEDACKSLYKVRKYCADPTTATEQYISNVASAEWSKHGVFDIFLWSAGNAQQIAPADGLTSASLRRVRG